MLSKTLGQILVKGEKKFNLSPFAFYKIKNAFEALIKEPLILKETDASLDVLKRQLKKELKKIYLDEYETKFYLLLSFFNPVSEDFFKTHALKEGMDNSPLLDCIFKAGYFTSYLDEDKLKKNYKFIFDQCEPNLKITINFAKPEKNPRPKKPISPQKCQLCYDNVGLLKPEEQSFKGGLLPLKVHLHDDYFIQASPYQYVDHHIIVISDVHRPMKMDRDTFYDLLTFVELCPRYFLGANAELPGIGGSILTHDHYQGGQEVLPLFKAKTKQELLIGGQKVEILDFFNNVIKIKGRDKQSLIDFASRLLSYWRNYRNPSLYLYPYKNRSPHQTFTSIARKEGEEFALYLIFRSNVTNKDYPLGVFHVHPERLFVKKESIGLIEASGVFILPPRVLINGRKIFDKWTNKERIIGKLKDYSGFLPYFEKYHSLETSIGKICEEILFDTRVFKNDDDFIKALYEFKR